MEVATYRGATVIHSLFLVIFPLRRIGYNLFMSSNHNTREIRLLGYTVEPWDIVC